MVGTRGTHPGYTSHAMSVPASGACGDGQYRKEALPPGRASYCPVHPRPRLYRLDLGMDQSRTRLCLVLNTGPDLQPRVSPPDWPIGPYTRDESRDESMPSISPINCILRLVKAEAEAEAEARLDETELSRPRSESSLASTSGLDQPGRVRGRSPRAWPTSDSDYRPRTRPGRTGSRFHL